MEDEPINAALAAANVALSGKSQSYGNRLASIELRAVDAHTGAWEIAALVSVALATTLAVVGVWFI
jgi:hypothetical protein